MLTHEPQRLRQLPDEALLAQMEAETDPLLAAMATAELEARTAPKPSGSLLSRLVAEHRA